jgi:hypothetical protein
MTKLHRFPLQFYTPAFPQPIHLTRKTNPFPSLWVNLNILGNAVYAPLSELAFIGKNLCQDKDETRYNDYVLYHGKYSRNAPEAKV